MTDRRKCGTCRYYEASPLKGKGWCRNPLLYNGNQNHLVDEKEYSCFRTFGSHWDAELDVEETPRSTRPIGQHSPIRVPPAEPEAYESAPEPGRNDVQTTPRRRPPRRAPRVPFLPLIGVALIVVVMSTWFWQSKQPPEVPTPTATATSTPVATATAIPTATATPTETPPPAASTATPLPAPTMGVGAIVQVTNTEGRGLKMRESPGVSSAVVRQIDEGTTLQVAAGPESADGHTWWQVSIDGQTGWCAADWLALAPQ